MAREFKDHFAALFGRPPKEYDPVEWGEKPKERALDIQENVPGIDIAGERPTLPYKAPCKPSTLMLQPLKQISLRAGQRFSVKLL
ncbi:hypothetical protein LCGC14_1433890 [marine sediment metagenome]|uniref:Uncharacterized protein n=1 Tax=marine sediment metagenome TaxID=412755 RepID=A0A0F9M392_9ZZZZ